MCFISVYQKELWDLACGLTLILLTLCMKRFLFSMLIYSGLDFGVLNTRKMTGVKNKSGGFREGSGRKLKYKEPTKAMRIPLSLVPKVEKMLQQLKNKTK